MPKLKLVIALVSVLGLTDCSLKPTEAICDLVLSVNTAQPEEPWDHPSDTPSNIRAYCEDKKRRWNACHKITRKQCSEAGHQPSECRQLLCINCGQFCCE